MKTFKKLSGMPNEILEFDGFFVSYNSMNYVNSHIPPGVDKVEDETAIVVRTSSDPFGIAYYILRGDYREQYLKCNTLEDCMKVFQENEANKSIFSN